MGPQGPQGPAGVNTSLGLMSMMIGSGDEVYAIANDTWVNSSIAFITTDLEVEVVKGSGTYRVDLELYFTEEVSSTQLLVGIRRNNNTPVLSAFTSSTLVIRNNNSECLNVSLFLTLNNGDFIRPDFKTTFRGVGSVLQLNSLKMFVTKVIE
jgi:hypothetical protein